MHCLFAPDCRRPRIKRGRFCRHHARRLNQYGSALGRPIPRPNLLHFAAQAGRLLKDNQDHEGVLWATKELETLLTDARTRVLAGSPVDSTTREYSRLSAHGVTPLHILTMIVAVALFDEDEPRWLRDTQAYRFAVARAVLGLTSRRGEDIGSRTLKTVGTYLVERYAPLASSVVIALKKREAEDRARHAAMSAPMKH